MRNVKRPTGLIVFAVLFITHAAFSTVAAGEVITKTDWCVITLPENVNVDEALKVHVKFFGLKPKMNIYCDIHYEKKDGNWGGKMRSGGSFLNVGTDGERTFTVKIPGNKPAAAKVFATVFVSQKGWTEKVKVVNSEKTMLTFAADKTPARRFTPLKLVDGYLSKHPRLLFSKMDVPALKLRAANNKEIWAHVMVQANWLVTRKLPDANLIKSGARYYRSEWMLSGALAYVVTGEVKYKTALIKWMKAHSAVSIWGTGWGENVDIPANWYLYYISLAYDMIHDEISEADKKQIVSGLLSHGRAVYSCWLEKDGITYDQNHTYVPIISLIATALAIGEREKEAASWLSFGHEIMRRCRMVLTPDGYYYEGTGYWEYAFHWHIRYADLISRATGEEAFSLPIFKNQYNYLLHHGLPGGKMFDIGDTGKGATTRGEAHRSGRKHMIYRLASVFKDRNAQAAADMFMKHKGEVDAPSMYFLWYDQSVKPAPVKSLPTFHHFTDYGIVSWRSSWQDDASVYLFHCGPPVGYSSEAVLEKLPDWRMNTGHVHPDVGAFWMYAKGAYLATDTGYTQRKRTRDHNTILVDDQGMGADYTYWVHTGFPDRTIPYSTWTPAKLEKVHLEKEYGYAKGDFSTIYDESLGKLNIQRHVIMSNDFLIVLDEQSGVNPHKYTFMLHSDNQFKTMSANLTETQTGDAKLLVYTLSPTAFVSTPGPAMMFYGKSPNKGEDRESGYQLAVATDGRVKSNKLVNVLIPIKAGAKKPRSVDLLKFDQKETVIKIVSGDGKAETITLNLAWKSGSKEGPVARK